MRRRARALPTFVANGWTVAKMPNSFAERYVWVASAVDADGYVVVQHGFQTKGAVEAFCANVRPPARKACKGISA